MGLAFSAAKGRLDVYKMNAFMEVDFQSDILSQMEVIKSEGQREVLANLNEVGALGGGYGGSNGAGSYGSSYRFWEFSARMVNGMALWMIPIMLTLGLVAGFGKMGEILVFLATALFTFFFTFFVQYHSAIGRQYMVSYRPFLGSLLAAALVGVVVVVAIYTPYAEAS